MKFNFNFQSFKFHGIEYTIVCILFLGLTMFGCSNEFDNSIENSSEYLDFDINNHDRTFTEDEIFILKKAFLRIENYILFDNGKTIIYINHKDLNISERLYNYLSVCNYSIESKLFIRLKSGDVEVTYGPNYMIRETNLNHDELITLMNGMQSDYTHIGYASAIAAWFPGAAFGAFLVGSKSYLETLSWSNLENNYIESGSSNGAQLVEFTTYSPTTGMSFTSLQLIIN